MPSSPAIALRVNPSSRKSWTARFLNSSENRLVVLGRRATPLGGLGFFFSTSLVSSCMVTLHSLTECQPLFRLDWSHDLVARTVFKQRRISRNQHRVPTEAADAI